MAKLDTSGLDELFRDMMYLHEDCGEAASAMLEAAAPIVERALRQSAIAHGFSRPGKSGRGTGDMIVSIDNFGVERTRDGKLKLAVRSMGRDGNGNYNSEVAFVQNYGRSNMPATHWIDEAVASCASEVEEVMTTIWENFLEGRQ